MAHIAKREEYLYILEKMIKDAMPCSKKFIMDNIATFYRNTVREISKNIIVDEFDKAFYELIDKTDFPRMNKLDNKKAFISIPITGQEELAREKCQEIKKHINNNYPTCEVFSPFEVAPEKNMPDSYYMGKYVEQLMNCDIMIQMNGWENSKGCRVENFIADTYNIEKIPIDSLFI